MAESQRHRQEMTPANQRLSFVRDSGSTRGNIQRNGTHQRLVRMGIGLLVRFKTVDTFGHPHGVYRGQGASRGLMHGSFAKRLSARNCTNDGCGVTYVPHDATLSKNA